MAFRTVLQQRVRVCPSGRTDAGVSARGQVCQFDALYPHPPDTLGTPGRCIQPLRVTAAANRHGARTSTPATPVMNLIPSDPGSVKVTMTSPGRSSASGAAPSTGRLLWNLATPHTQEPCQRKPCAVLVSTPPGVI